MFRQFFTSLHEIERGFSRSFGTDIATPAGRRAATWHFYLSDHGFLRGLWTNLFQIAPGVWRSNQPSPRRLKRYRGMGIRSVLNLRGADKFSFYLFEKEACDALGLTLIDHKIYARSLVDRDRFGQLFQIFDRIERPFVMHCKSGADRAGLAAALWLIDKEAVSVTEARAQLGLKYAHLKSSKTGVLDHLLDTYQADTADSPMPIRQWFAERYDPGAIEASFRRKMGWPEVAET